MEFRQFKDQLKSLEETPTNQRTRNLEKSRNVFSQRMLDINDSSYFGTDS